MLKFCFTFAGSEQEVDAAVKHRYVVLDVHACVRHPEPWFFVDIYPQEHAAYVSLRPASVVCGPALIGAT